MFNGASGAANVQEGHTGDSVAPNNTPNGIQSTEKGDDARLDQQQVSKETVDKDHINEQTLDASKSQNEESNEKINRIRTVISKVQIACP